MKKNYENDNLKYALFISPRTCGDYIYYYYGTALKLSAKTKRF